MRAGVHHYVFGDVSLNSPEASFSFLYLRYFQLSPTDKSMEHAKHFKIKHYAGDVIYSVLTFMDKNKDTLFQDFKRLLYNRCFLCLCLCLVACLRHGHILTNIDE